MRRIVILAILAAFLLSLAAAAPQSASAYDTLKADAEREYAEKSFRRAHELYEQAAKLELSAGDRRWVEFRLADTTLRADAASPNDDPTARNAAREALEKLIAAGPDDELRAEMNEALGDHFMRHPHERNPYGAQRWYVAALEFWAGSSDLDRARRRYLDIVWKLESEAGAWNVPRHVLVNAVQIAETPQDRARTRYMLATQLANEGNPASVERAIELLEEIIALGRKSDFYDDALFLLGSTYAQQRGPDDPNTDFVKALAAFQRLLAEFKPGETAYLGNARNAIKEITASAVSVFVAGTFLPDSEQQVIITTRNVKQVELVLYSVDLPKDARLESNNQDWMRRIAVEGKPVVRRWTLDTKDSGDHRPRHETMQLEPRLPVGAYILVATGGGESARQLVLVTDAHILVHMGHEKTQVFVSDVETGEPIANARVHVSQRHDRGAVTERDATTNADGLATIAGGERNGQLLITAAAGARQAYHLTYSYYYGRGQTEPEWRVYAFTDRPAYRPNEKVQWKVFARVRENDQWVTPAGATLDYEITDPRGQKVTSGIATLSSFGSYWSELELTEAMPLGAYTITFKSKNAHRGAASLFRLEEYKLPEFQVKVATPEGKQYRLGDTIEATIDASYYFGGPVANATVEAVVFQQPFYRYWTPWREYSWLYDPLPQQGGSIVKRETLQTDANGRALLRIDTQQDGSDTSYRIEARVVDASRREVRGEGNVRVTRQRYTVMAHPEHYVHRPGDSVSVDFKAMDANDQPVVTTGTVQVFLRKWTPPVPIPYRAGIRRPPVPPPGVPQDEKISETKLTTDAKGEATLTFTPTKIGYYVVRWMSSDGSRVRDRVTTETAVWVADRTTTELGYYTGSGLDLIVDKDTLRAGETAAVLVVTPAAGRWVLFSTSADDILDTRVLRLDGTVQLVQVPVDKRHIPNFFITASSIFDRNVATDVERIAVPPVEQFLTVDVKPDREEYQPRQEGTVTITTRDADGKPVSAEVALAVSDEAVTAIQQDLAGDPRQFFYGRTRGNPIQVSAGLHSQRYVREEEKTETDEEDAKKDGWIMDAVQEVGAAVGNRARTESAAMAPPPPPAPAPVAQSVTVTAEAPMLAKDAAGADQQQGIEVQVRSDFRSTAFWKPDIVTGPSGTATVKVQYPEALTTWRATARAATATSQFGIASSTARTNMPLLVRLQGPRFFVVGDRVVISAVINNNTDQPQTVTPSLEAEGLTTVEGSAASLTVPANGEARADWTMRAEKAGPAKLRVTAKSATHGDAMERTFTVYEHGIDKLIARSGKMKGDEIVSRLELPRERRGTDLVVQVAPSLAVTMLDALPYLIQFPYGCTEQTMSRFLPAAIVARTLEQLKLGRARIAGKDLDAVTAQGIARLYDMQHGDGGWGWWKQGDSDPFMTAYVVWGFAVARDGGIRIDANRVDRAANWLSEQLIGSERAYNDQAWMLHALSAWRKAPGQHERRAFDNVWTNRERLSAYSRALIALTAHRWSEAERARTLIRNLEDGVQVDAENNTAHWGSSARFWWRWYESPVETTAFALQALVTIDPQHKLVEPAMNWLVRNRRGAQWNNTRDTAIALLSLNDYLKSSGELAGDVSYELSVNGKVIATKSLTAADVLGAPSRYTIPPDVLRDTTQEVRIRRTAGKSPLYFAAEARFFSLEEPVKAAGNEIFVKREYFRLKPRPTLLKGVQYDRVPLRDQESVASGDRIEVVVTIETKNDYSYLMFEDLKPAGFEAVELQSGGSLFAKGVKTGHMRWVHRELRDRKVALFADQLSQGTWEIQYTLRAEVPGSFHALPLIGQAMYVPEVRGNSDEVRVTVSEE